MMCKKPYMKSPVPTRRPVTHDERLACTPMPCGHCLPCRVNKARQWVTRIMLEAGAHKSTCFVTLTYNDDFIPKGDKKNGERVGMCCLDKVELQNFFKRLRKKIDPIRIRYFAVGEYGSINLRPHFHIVIFGLGVEDRPVIASVWTDRGIEIGFVHVGDLTNYSARYITNYAMKNLTDMDDPWVKKNYPLLAGREPEFMTSSRLDGGIGTKGIKRIADQWNKSNITEKRIVREFSLFGREVPLGRYLTKKFAEYIGVEEELFEKELYDYQDELFENFIKKGVIYYDNLTEYFEPKRLSQRKRIEIFKQRRSI